MGHCITDSSPTANELELGGAGEMGVTLRPVYILRQRDLIYHGVWPNDGPQVVVGESDS